MKRILFVCPVGEKGGAEVFLLDIASHLDREKYEPLVACLKPGAFVDELNGLGIRAFALTAHKTREFHKVARAIGDLGKIVTRERIDLVHGNGGSLLFYSFLAAAGTPARVVWQVHDPLSGGGGFERAFVAAQRRMRPDWTIYSNPAVAESYRGTYRNLKQTSVVLPGVDAAGLAAGADAARGRARLGMPADAPLVAMFARMQRAKGHPFLIEAAQDVLQTHPDARFVVCGGTLFGKDPEYPAEIEQQAAQAGIAERFHLRGYVSEEEKKDTLAAADVVVHPALSEPFGISVIEGMAAGTPVVATDCAGPSLTVVDGETGLLVPRGDSKALAAALRRVLDHPDEARQMGRCGRARAEELYTVEAMSRQVAKIYDQVLGQDT